MSDVYRLPQWHTGFGGGLFGGPRLPGFVSEGTEVVDAAGHPDSYRMKALCLNCKWEGQVREAVGKRVRRAPGYECPACKCLTVEATEIVGRDSKDGDSRNHMEEARERQAEMMARYEVEKADYDAKRKAQREREASPLGRLRGVRG